MPGGGTTVFIAREERMLEKPGGEVIEGERELREVKISRWKIAEKKKRN